MKHLKTYESISTVINVGPIEIGDYVITCQNSATKICEPIFNIFWYIFIFK